MEWWAWLIAGFVLLAVEMATPGGFVSLFFGVGAVLVALLVAMGMGGPAWLQWVLFPLFSVALLAVLRGYLRDRLQGGPDKKVDSLIGETAVLLADLAPGSVGKVELRGTTWNAQTTNWEVLKAGQRCVVDRVEGLTLWILPPKEP